MELFSRHSRKHPDRHPLKRRRRFAVKHFGKPSRLYDAFGLLKYATGRLSVVIPGLVLLLGLSLSASAGAGDQPLNYSVVSKGIKLFFSPDGRIQKIIWGDQPSESPLMGFSAIAGFHQSGQTKIRKTREGGLVFTRILVSDSLQQSCILVEKFTPTANSIRWELEIRGQGRPWSGAINTEIYYPATRQTRFWTAWGSPPYEASAAENTSLVDNHQTSSMDNHLPADNHLKEELKPVPGGSALEGFMGPGNNQWVDPLIPVPFIDTTFYYGLPYFTYANPRIAVCPFQGNLFCIPMCSILEPGQDLGLTVALSPADDLVDLVLQTGQQGHIRFSRLFNRITPDHPVRFAMDIAAHVADWRAGLGWMAARYPGYFEAKNKHSGRLAGTGAYAGPFEVIENRKMRDMDFTTNWQASFDFPYMGMFLPPVKNDQPWKRFGDSTISINQLSAYAARMKKAGFHVLNYFNVTEFGARVKYPPPAGIDTIAPADWWKDCNAFLYRHLPNAIFPTPVNMKQPEGNKTVPGSPIYTWEGGIVMDCGEPVYRNFLLEQASRHIRNIPDADGICIDRMDWLRMFNERADDGKTWFEGRAVRSLINSFKELMDTLGPLMHGANKSIFVNNHDKRIDLLKQADGIFDEFTYAGAPLNLTAFLCVEKPAMGWTDAAATVKKEGADNFFQKYLYMGVFPMCPYPANDHSIMPDSLVDQYYVEYAPLLKKMSGRRWVLKPHVVEVENELAKANLFTVDGGWVMPVVYGKADTITVRMRPDAVNSKNAATTRSAAVRQMVCRAWYPGRKEGVVLKPIQKGGSIEWRVPLIRGCAMVSCEDPEDGLPAISGL